MKSLVAVVALAIVITGNSASAGSADEAKTAENFADALSRDDIMVGVYSVPSRGIPTTLPTGEVLENVPGYAEAAIQNSLCVLRLVESIHGPTSAVVFISQLPMRVEGQQRAPFVGIPGSTWILALKQREEREIESKQGDHTVVAPEVVSMNSVQLFNGRYGMLCTSWPTEKGLERPEYVTIVDQSVVHDLKQIVASRAGRANVDNLNVSLESTIGKLVGSSLLRRFGKPGR